MTIQRRNRTHRLELEPLDARDVPSVVSPHAGLLRPMARAEVHKAAHRITFGAARVHAPAAVAASSTARTDAVSSSIPPAGSSPEPIIIVLGPVLPAVETEGQVQISPPMTATAPVLIGFISTT